jgi:O-antigen ligase
VRWVRDDGYLLVLAVLFWLIFYQNLPSDLGGMNEKRAFADANGLARTLKLGTIAISGYLIWIRWRLARNFSRYLNPGLVAYFVLAALSMTWSIDASATLARVIALASVLLLCFAFGLASWYPRRFQHVAIPPIMLILIASILVGAIDPTLVTETGNDIAQKNAWHGITHSKNEFGMLASFGTILCVNTWMVRRWDTGGLLAAAGAIVALICVILSKSNTSLFATAVAVVSMALVMRVPLIKRRHTNPVVISIASVILFYEMVIQNVIPGVDVLLAPVVGLTGKDTTFSARTVIWKVIKEHIQLSPFLGSGYGGYWVGPFPSSPSYIFLSVMYLYPTESHNGYLEVVNDLGLVGLCCLLLFLFWYIRQALQLMHTDRSQAALYLGLLFQEMVIDMSESDWFSRSNTFAVLALASVCLSRALYNLRLQEVGSRPVAASR